LYYFGEAFFIIHNTVCATTYSSATCSLSAAQQRQNWDELDSYMASSDTSDDILAFSGGTSRQWMWCTASWLFQPHTSSEALCVVGSRSGRLLQSLTACELRSFCTVFIQDIPGHPSSFFHCAEDVKSQSVSCRSCHPRRHDYMTEMTLLARKDQIK